MRICYTENGKIKVINIDEQKDSLLFDKEAESLYVVRPLSSGPQKSALISWKGENWNTSANRLTALHILDAFLNGNSFFNAVAKRAEYNEKTPAEIAGFLKSIDHRLGIDYYVDPEARKEFVGRLFKEDFLLT